MDCSCRGSWPICQYPCWAVQRCLSFQVLSLSSALSWHLHSHARPHRQTHYYYFSTYLLVLCVYMNHLVLTLHWTKISPNAVTLRITVRKTALFPALFIWSVLCSPCVGCCPAHYGSLVSVMIDPDNRTLSPLGGGPLVRKVHGPLSVPPPLR